MSDFKDRRLVYGYADTSTRKYPKEPETIILGQDVIEKARCVGFQSEPIGRWFIFKVPNVKRYYFQLQQW